MLSLAWNLPHQLTKHFWKLFPVLHDLRGCFLICENGHYFYSCVSIRSTLILSQGHAQTHGVSLHAWSEQCLPGTLQGNGCSEDLSYSPCRFSPSTHLLNSALLVSGLSVPFPEPWIFVLCLGCPSVP